MIMECSLPDEHTMATHLTPSSAARMAHGAQPGLLLITHVYPQLDRAALPRLLHDAGWAGETLIAHDGMTLEVTVG